MGSAYIVLGALAALGLVLGWRMTPAPVQRSGDEGLARLLQLGVAFTGMLVLVLLLVPWFSGLAQVGCTPEAEQAGKCIVGVEDRALFGASAFACLVGAGFAFILRRGVLDFPEAAPLDESKREAGVGDMDTMTDAREAQRSSKAKPKKAEPKAKAEPEGETEAKDESEPEPEPESESESAVDESESESAVDEGASDPVETQAEPEPLPAHRRLEGPVFRAFVEDEAVELEAALRTAVERLGSERVGVVFSRGASKDANVALLELAEAYDAHRYVLEGTAAATEGIPTGQQPDPNAADEVAGSDARHAGELALDLAGAFIQTVFLLDTRVAFPKLVLDQLTKMQSVCIAHAHDEVSGACQVVLPGTNPGEREGELIDSAGGTNSRRPRAWLVARLVELLAEHRKTEAGATNDDDGSA